MRNLAASSWLLVWSAACSAAGHGSAPESTSCDALVGEYRGSLRIYGRDGVREVPMMLVVAPEATAADRYRFGLGYGEDDKRDYVLIVDDRATGACRIDERNGIELAAQWQAGELVSVFSAGGQTLVTRYRVVPPGIEFALEAFALADARTTGGGVTTQPRVAVQRALLVRR
jgi:hypothetical protein